VLEMKRHIYGLANTMRLVDRAKYVAKLFWHIYIYSHVYDYSFICITLLLGKRKKKTEETQIDQ
jgi:hypothetical protein